MLSPTAFSTSSIYEYISNPMLAKYAAKLSSSLYVLFSSTSSNLLPSISSLSILIHNRSSDLHHHP